MSLRPWLTASVLMVSLAGWIGQPAPTQARYRIGITSQQKIDLSALGQGTREQTVQTVGFVSISTSDSAGGTVVVIRVDSVSFDSSVSAPQATLDSLRGSTSRNYFGPDGRMTRLSRDNASTALLSLGLDGLSRRFVPPSAAHRKSGSTWTDTVDVIDTLPAGSVSTRTVTNFATGEETVQGAKAIRVLGTSSSGIQGSQSSDEGEVSFDGIASGNSTWYYGQDAVAISGSSKSSQDLKITSPNSPAPIPINVQTDVTVTRLK
jgi:hypothetical protein